MNQLPPELAFFAELVDAQPQSTQEAFQYCLCLMMVEAGKMQLASIIPTDTTPLCVFISIAGERFAVHRPPITKAEEQQLIEALREIMEDEDLD